nr:N-acetylmuramoyl-L-alanine amidase [uncultured Anaerostipes sp.]
MAKYNVHGGHNKKVPGASEYLDEVAEDRKVKKAVIQYLKAAGHTAYDCTDDAGTTQSKNLANIVAKCNAHTVALDISIHLNAGGGTGCEVYYTSDKGKPYAKKVSAAVAKALGIKDRGAKASDTLYVLNHTKSPAILVECCFVDNKTDQKAWNAEKCAKAIVEAVTGKAVTSSGSGSSGNNASASSGSKPSSGSSNTAKAKVTVDGYWGPNTTKALQKIFGTTADGRVSNQFKCYKSQNPGLEDGWDWKDDPSGYSPLIKAIQKKVGATQDGHIGPKTIKKIQKWMGTTQDGVFSKASPCIKKLQQWINKQ